LLPFCSKNKQLGEKITKGSPQLFKVVAVADCHDIRLGIRRSGIRTPVPASPSKPLTPGYQKNNK